MAKQVSEKENPNNPRQPLRILSIGAHPADIFDQCGGTLAHHVERGDWVGCCVLTHGARVHDEVIAEEMFHRSEVPDTDELEPMMAERSDGKAQEVRRACAILGIENIYFFGVDDTVLLLDRAIILRLAEFLREIRPEIILTHSPIEDGGWNTHAVTGQIVKHAVWAACSVHPGDRNPPHRTAALYFFGEGGGYIPGNVWNAHRTFYNDIIIDTTDVIEKKLACLDLLVSQGYGGAYARKRLETSDGAFGKIGDVAYGEAFITEKTQTWRHLPISDHTLNLGKMSDHEIMNLYSYRVDT